MDDASLRASDADRERAVAALRGHLLAGRLSLEEFCERVGTALAARMAGELVRVQQDLPVVLAGPSRPGRRPARFTAAVLGHVVRRGRVRLGPWALAASAFADLDLDLREASMDRQRTAVTVLAAFANVDIYVPEGVHTDVSGLTILGHRRDWGHDSVRPDAPVIHVRVAGVAGAVDVWRVPHDLRASSYSDIFRALEGRHRQLPA
jgi:hypothetical protein